MGWTHDTGYGPAYDHEGYPANVLDDGTDTGTWTRAIGERVTGWRAACDCGWRGEQFYPRAEWPSASGAASEAVDGWETGRGCYAEWSAHLEEAVPTLAVHDLAERLADTQEALRAAVAKARAAGQSWTTIGLAAGMSRQAAHERWSS